MRMRKKKRLEERLAAVSDILFTGVPEDKNVKIAISKKEYLNLEEWFGNSNEVFLEIGCGKGKFACEFAKAHPEINLLAVEKCGNVLVTACETAKKMGLNNLKFIKCGAEYLPKYLNEQSIGRIFLNFSCPYPKNSYANQRLTHERFLEVYKTLLKPQAEIHQKTDNMHFFEYSIESLSRAGFILKNISLDLHNSGFEGNIETEYEQKFASLGQPIYRLEAFFGGKR
ncbi:MAG: tRNA (guanosine(46)-N7)-methyltransferase TrmB [Acutalibacteraceae bacterium]|jgi:tRNA (guanine-N7-)-methyltransferase